MKTHYIKKETVFHDISHTVEKKISSEIFSTNFKVSDIEMRQQNKFGDFGYCLLNRGCPLNTGFTVVVTLRLLVGQVGVQELRAYL